MAMLWECDNCGGPATWTIIDGEPYYHCEQQCDGFRQLELFGEDGVRDPVRGHESDGLTRVSSIMNRASPDGEGLPF